MLRSPASGHYSPGAACTSWLLLQHALQPAPAEKRLPDHTKRRARPKFIMTKSVESRVIDSQATAIEASNSTTATEHSAEVHVACCVICLEAGGPDLFQHGCGCRGSAGSMHVSCGVEAALADLPQSRKWWLQCQTCKQDWTGRMLRGLANERFKLANHRYRRNNVAPKDLEWTHAAQQLMHSLRQTGEAAALLELAERTLVETRSSFGVDHPETLQVQVRLANAYADTRAYAEAIPLFLSLLKTLRHLPASEFAFGLLCGTASSLSDLFSTMGHYGPALPLAEETLARRRETLGDDSELTLRSMHNLACLYSHMYSAEYFEPSALLWSESVQRRRRVLGNKHRDTLLGLAGWGACLRDIGEFSAAAPLLEEAVAGFAAITDGDLANEKHPHHNTLVSLQKNQRCLSDPAFAAMCLQRDREFTSNRPNCQLVFAKITGVKSQPHLNRSPVQVMQFAADSGRYTVQVLKPHKTPASAGVFLSRNLHQSKKCVNLKPENIVLMGGGPKYSGGCGTDIIVTGLVGKPELNGRGGVVEGFNAGVGRYVVRVESEMKRKSLQPKNCRAVLCY